MQFVATGEHMAITGIVAQLRTTDMASHHIHARRPEHPSPAAVIP